MGKLYRNRDLLLLGLAILGDLYIWSVTAKSRMIRNLNRDPFAPPIKYTGALRTAVSRLFRTGMIEKTITRGQAVWQLTGSGNNYLQRTFPLLKWQEKKWDGVWRIVIFDIKINRNWLRNKLRRQLRELGFGQWQKSVYVSPHDVAEDIKEFLEAENLIGQAAVLECRELWPNNQEKIERMWHLDQVNRMYRSIVENHGKIGYKNLKAKYLEIIAADPFLPKEFLPQPWFGDKARMVITKV